MSTSTPAARRTAASWVAVGLVALAGLVGLASTGHAQTGTDPDPLLHNKVGDRGARRFGIHNGNRVATTFSNYGLIAGTLDTRPEGTWPTGTQDKYVGDVSPLIGIEFLVARDTLRYVDASRLRIVLPSGQQVLVNGTDTTRILRNVVVGGEVRAVRARRPRHSVSTSDGPRGGTDGPNSTQLWTLEPLPGFNSADTSSVAMSQQPKTWPTTWPDHPDWVDPASGKAVWNGYFGRGKTQADQESYAVMDDNNDNEWLPLGFRPDSTNPSRHGMGLRVKIRGLQWSNFLAENCIFWLYDITNVGTTDYEKAGFGLVVGTLVGGRQDSNDDLAFFDQSGQIAYSFDSDDRPSPGWTPIAPGYRNIGYVGYAILESPGNPYDGIDNDDDAANNALTPRFTSDDFQLRRTPPRRAGASPLPPFTPKMTTYNAGDFVVLIDRKDANGRLFQRRVVKLTRDTLVFSLGRPYEIQLGVTPFAEDTTSNAFDDDLDGLIDENYFAHFYRRRLNELDNKEQQLPAVQHRDYVADFKRFGGAAGGSAAVRANELINVVKDPRQPDTFAMLDEGRDDGVDNDGDWNVSGRDDVGRDGLGPADAAYPGPDEGEGDGRPTAGEPNFDQTDINESDQLGLTSFSYKSGATSIPMNNDESLWNLMAPGTFDAASTVAEDGDFVFGTGYFPLPAGATERMSLSLVYGVDLRDIIRNKARVQQIYDSNYLFARPPANPTVVAVPADRKVTLYWTRGGVDDVDPLTGEKDFEGFKIYRSEDPSFNDIRSVSDIYGNPSRDRSIAQFDVINGPEGVDQFFTPQGGLADQVQGAPYYLGANTGLRFTYTDSTVQNGRTYYYAVVSYDRGAQERGIYPSENTKFASRDRFGRVATDKNVVQVTPQRYAPGYQAPAIGDSLTRTPGTAGTGTVSAHLIDPRRIRPNAKYEVRFYDASNDPSILPSDTTYRGLDKVLPRITTSYSLYDVTNGGNVPVLLHSHDLTGLADLAAQYRLNNAAGDSIGSAATGIQFEIENAKAVAVTDRYYTTKADSALYTLPSLTPFDLGVTTRGVAAPSDYVVTFLAQLTGRSSDLVIDGELFPGQPVNVSVYDRTRNKPVRFSFIDGGGDPTRFDIDDIIIFIERYPKPGSRTDSMDVVTWSLQPGANIVDRVAPTNGAQLVIETSKPFRTGDVFVLQTGEAATVNNAVANASLNQIKVVPNPYVVRSSYEIKTGGTGVNNNVLRFTNVPLGATIRIYNARGELIQTLTQGTGNTFGSDLRWNLTTREGLDVSFGVYFYHVKTLDGTERTGKFAIIR